ncbi:MULTISPECIES: hypothetical protein [unclassified Bradyrhizobium]|uniref:hypothetical protein n=1 Tax=unclassified Bradyrhizobium TaxID=2631580 RepID=UPI001FFA8AC1|nr:MULTISPECIES: hypothetical protein [unclassified Bradyrhizobium]
MLDAATTALLRSVLDEVCASLPRDETGARAHVAAKILEAANTGEKARERLKHIAREALSGTTRNVRAESKNVVQVI